jgi:hypothetical protein
MGRRPNRVVDNYRGDIMLKMLRALFARREPVETGSTFVGFTADVDNGQSVRFHDGDIWWALQRLASWPAPIFVNVYELDRTCAGSEEGGWWVTTRTPVASESVIGTADILPTLRRLSDRFSRNVANDQGISSVVYGGGEYCFAVENEPGEFYPSDREAWQYA